MNERPSTLSSRISAHILDRIGSGAWRAGDRVPTEAALMEEFAASRMTVHHVLKDLARRGYLKRTHGAGTVVAAPRPYVTHYDHHDIIEEIEARGARHSARVVVQHLRPATAAEAADFDVAPETPLFHAVVIHMAEAKPFELEDRLIDPAYLPDCLRANLAKQSLFSLLMTSRPLRDGEERVRAVTPSDEDRDLLDVAPTQPCLETIRRTWTHEGVVTRVRLLRAGCDAVMSGRIAPAPVQERAR